MPDPIIEEQDNNIAKADIFGSENKPPEVVPPKEDEEGEDGEGEGEGDKKVEKKEEKKEDKGGKKFAPIPDDHPTIVALRKEINDIKEDKTSMGGNLSAQRETIKKLEQKVESLTGKKSDDTSHLPFDPKTIVYSKDLPKDKLEDMTDNEIKLHDELMKTHEVMNKEAQARFEEKQRAEAERQGAEDKKVEDLNTSVRSIALELAKDDKTLANQIIEKSKKFNLEGLTEKELKETLEDAYKLLPSYVPPKERKTPKGGTPVINNDNKSDAFGTTQIVEEVSKKRSGEVAFTL